MTYGVVVAPVRVLHARENMGLGLVGREASMDDGGGERRMMVQPGCRHLDYKIKRARCVGRRRR